MKIQDKLKDTYSQTINFLTLILIPLTFFIVVNSHEIVKLLFFRGAFNLNDVSITSKVFQSYIIGLLFLSIREILIRFFFAMNDSKTPLILSFFSVVINIILNIYFYKTYGVFGIALATSLSLVIMAPVYILLIQKKLNFLNFKYIFISIIKIIFSTCVVGFLILIIKNYLIQSINFNNITIFLYLSISFIIYYILYLYFLKILRNKIAIKTLNMMKKFLKIKENI